MQVFHVPDQNYHLRNLGFEPGLSQEEGDKNFAEFLSRSESKFAGAEILKAFLNTPLSLKSDPKFIYYAYGHRPEEYQTAKIVGDLHGQHDQWQLGDYKNYILKKFNDEVKGFSLEEKSFFADRFRSILRHKIRLVQSGEADQTKLGEDGLKTLAKDAYERMGGLMSRRNLLKGAGAAGIIGVVGGSYELSKALNTPSTDDLKQVLSNPEFNIPPTPKGKVPESINSSEMFLVDAFQQSLFRFLEENSHNVSVYAIQQANPQLRSSKYSLILTNKTVSCSASILRKFVSEAIDLNISDWKDFFYSSMVEAAKNNLMLIKNLGTA
jgi:hypothetical protein